MVSKYDCERRDFIWCNCKLKSCLCGTLVFRSSIRIMSVYFVNNVIHVVQKKILTKLTLTMQLCPFVVKTFNRKRGLQTGGVKMH